MQPAGCLVTPSKTKRPSEEGLFWCEPPATGRLTKLDRATIEERMGDLLDDMQMDGLLARRERILHLVRSRIIRDGQGPTFYQ